jgi:hypothetical protein
MLGTAQGSRTVNLGVDSALNPFIEIFCKTEGVKGNAMKICK